MAASLLALVLVLDKTSWFYHPKPWLALALLLTFASIPKYLASKDLVEISAGVNRAYTVSLVLFALLTLWMGISRGPDWMRRREFRWNQVSVASGLFLITVMMMWKANTDDGKLLYRSRNFYGALRVQEQTAGPFKFVELLHGRIAHGLQFESNDPAERDTPTSYYNRISGAGLALSYHPRSGPLPMRVGAIGLGVGTLAAYSRPGDVYRFYDINPAVIELAQGKNGYFSFLKDTKGKIEIVRGDARLSLESELAHGGGQQYDVLLIDAFNGDSIPMHLLTVEAMEIYLKHLRGPDSLIAVHISNLAVNLEPVTAGLAEHFGMNATLISTEEKNDAMLASDWVLLTRGNALNAPVFRSAGFPLLKLRPGDFKPIAPIWTDDHSDVFSLLKKEKQP
jgi:SAM-dependent methyltransferase